MSKSSDDEMKNNIQIQNSSIKCQSEPQIKKTYSIVLGQNIPVIDDSKVTQRKSWVIANTPDNSSSSGLQILNKFSTERLKTNPSPEFNSSYCYKSEVVEFDSPEPPSAVSYFDNFSVEDIDNLAENNSSEVKSESVNENDDFQSFSVKSNVLPNSETELSTYHRDTIDCRSIIIQQNATIRSKSSSKMVQFAPLSKSDSWIKALKSECSSNSNFVVTDDLNKADVSQDLCFSRKSTQFVVKEECNDDLDGIQPLGVNVSSLIDSSILDVSSVNKLAKYRSRDNQVMSFIGNFENCIHDFSKTNIRASDILSLNESKTNGNTSTNGSSRNSNIFQDFASSKKQMNIKNIFEANNSFKNASCYLENEPMVQEINESSEQNIESNSKSEINISNDRITDNIFDKVSDSSNYVSSSNYEYEFNISSPFKIKSEFNFRTNIVTNHNNSTLVDTEKDNYSTKEINNQHRIESSSSTLGSIDTFDIHNCINSFSDVNQALNEEVSTNVLKISNNVSVLVGKDNLEGMHQEQNSTSEFTEKSMKDLCVESDVLKVVEKSTNIEKDSINVQNDISDFVDNSIYVGNDNSNAQSGISKLVVKSAYMGKDYTGVQSDFSILVDKSTRIEKEHIDLQNDVSEFDENDVNIQNQSNVLIEGSKIIEKFINLKRDHFEVQNNMSKHIHEESPSMVFQCMSKIFNTNDDKLEITDSQFNESLIESYGLVDCCKLKITSNNANAALTEDLNNSMIDATEVQLDKMFHENTRFSPHESVSVSVNSLQDTDTEKTITSSLVSVKTDICDSNLEINDKSSKHSTDMLQATEFSKNIINSKKTIQFFVENAQSNSKSLLSGNITENVDEKKNKSRSTTPNINPDGIVDQPNKINCLTVFDSSMIQTEEMKHKIITVNFDDQINIGSPLPPAPIININQWSPIMKEFNESVRKACSSANSKFNNKNSCNKVLDATLGKPRYESTPLNKRSKFFNSTTSIQDNVNSHGVIFVDELQKKSNLTQSNFKSILPGNITENVDEQKNKSRSTTPNTNPNAIVDQQNKLNSLILSDSSMIQTGELKHKIITVNFDDQINIRGPSPPAINININQWSPIMKEFNEAVEKACSSANSKFNNINSCKKVLFSDELDVIIGKLSECDQDVQSNRNRNKSKASQLRSRRTSPRTRVSELICKSLTSDSEEIFEKKLLRKKNNKTSTITASRKPNIAVSTSESKQNSSVKLSSNKSVCEKTKEMTKKKNFDSKLPPTRRNLHVKMDKSELYNSNQKHSAVDVIVSDDTVSKNNTEIDSLKYTNVLETTKRSLRKRENNLSGEELKPTAKHFKKLTSNHFLKNPLNNKKNSAKILINEKAQEIQPLKLCFTRSHSTVNQSSIPKLNKISSPIIIKSVKVGKIKKTISSKSNKKPQPKSLSSKPIKENKNDYSEYESVSETEEILQQSRIIVSKPKEEKGNIKKKNVQLDESSSIPSKCNLRKKVDNLIVPSQSCTRSRKRAAETSPLYEPNSKGLKKEKDTQIKINATKEYELNSDYSIKATKQVVPKSISPWALRSLREKK